MTFLHPPSGDHDNPALITCGPDAWPQIAADTVAGAA